VVVPGILLPAPAESAWHRTPAGTNQAGTAGTASEGLKSRILLSASAGEAQNRFGVKAAGANTHGHLLCANEPLLLLKRLLRRFFPSAIQDPVPVYLQVNLQKEDLLTIIRMIGVAHIAILPISNTLKIGKAK
jgi:hypothetical protein